MAAQKAKHPPTKGLLIFHKVKVKGSSTNLYEWPVVTAAEVCQRYCEPFPNLGDSWFIRDYMYVFERGLDLRCFCAGLIIAKYT